jgi:hypothetical protein
MRKYILPVVWVLAVSWGLSEMAVTALRTHLLAEALKLAPVPSCAVEPKT